MPVLSMRIEKWSYAEFLFKEFLPLSVYVVNYTIPFTQNWLYVYSEQMGLPLIALIVPLWSLSVEEQFYAICPFIARRLRISRELPIILIGLALVSTIVRLVLCSFAEANNLTHFVWFFNTFARLEPFLVGIAIAAPLFLQPNTAEFVKRNTKIILILNIGIYACIFFFQPLTSHHEVFVIPLVAIACGMTVLLTLFCAPLAKFLSLAPLRYLGILSYSMYIIHKPVLWTLDHALKHQLSAETCWFIRLVAGYLITFCLANITYNVIEKGFLRYKRRFSRIQNLSLSTIHY